MLKSERTQRRISEFSSITKLFSLRMRIGLMYASPKSIRARRIRHTLRTKCKRCHSDFGHCKLPLFVLRFRSARISIRPADAPRKRREMPLNFWSHYNNPKASFDQHYETHSEASVTVARDACTSSAIIWQLFCNHSGTILLETVHTTGTLILEEEKIIYFWQFCNNKVQPVLSNPLNFSNY